jgi:hypothetical protein
MLNHNPATIGPQLMQARWCRAARAGCCRLRYFDPEGRRAGVPPDLAALVSEMTDTTTVVTLVNLSRTQPRSVIVQGGAYGEHRIESLATGGRTETVGARTFTVRLEPGAGAKLALQMRRYVEAPTITLPWERK